MNHACRLTATALAVLALAGCVEQRLVIRSNPPGARAFVNGQLAGETPVTIPFAWYTNYQIHVEHSGYLPVDVRETVRSPWYLWIPMDAVTEALPWRVVDQRQFAYELAPAPDGLGPPPWSVEQVTLSGDRRSNEGQGAGDGGRGSTTSSSHAPRPTPLPASSESP